MKSIPNTTLIYRLIHIDNLEICLERCALHAPNHMPNDGLSYKTIHNIDIQLQRRYMRIPCGPGGVIHDYISFYFGPRSPMLYQLHTGRVEGYAEGQEPLIYLVSTAQSVYNQGVGYVFSDGHGIAAFTKWYDDLKYLDKVDWDAVYARIWRDTVDDMDHQRRKQAEFLIYKKYDWSLIENIAVINEAVKIKVEKIMLQFAVNLRRPVQIRPDWYY